MALVGIMGGTFNPIHNAHLASLQSIKQQLRLDKIKLIPCQQPPHKASPGINQQHRVTMAELACQDIAGLEVDTVELSLPAPSYTINTLMHLTSNSADQFTLIIGTDSLQQLHTWHRYQDILANCRIVVMTRPGYKHHVSACDSSVQSYITDDLARFMSAQSGVVYLLDTPPLDISSTAVRAKFARSESVENDLPAKVLAYIRQHQLYVLEYFE